MLPIGKKIFYKDTRGNHLRLETQPAIMKEGKIVGIAAQNAFGTFYDVEDAETGRIIQTHEDNIM
ncbi:MAG: hypothetical protein ACM37W_16240 [Actinomycetota bacterium]